MPVTSSLQNAANDPSSPAGFSRVSFSIVVVRPKVNLLLVAFFDFFVSKGLRVPENRELTALGICTDFRYTEVRHPISEKMAAVKVSMRSAHSFLSLTGPFVSSANSSRKVLEERDLEPVMTRMREQLMSRNVASEVANDITASVQATLKDKKLKSFTRFDGFKFKTAFLDVSGVRHRTTTACFVLIYCCPPVICNCRITAGFCTRDKAYLCCSVLIEMKHLVSNDDSDGLTE